MAAWREKYKDLKKIKQKEFENNCDDIEIKVDPPYMLPTLIGAL